MRLADYMSRNPSEPAKPPNEYDENFIKATIDIIRETVDVIRQKTTKSATNKQQSGNVQRFHHKQKQNLGIARRFQTHYNKRIQTTMR